MERRVLLAVFLSFLVLMAYQTFVVKPRTKPVPGRSPQATSAPSPQTTPSTATESTTPAVERGPEQLSAAPLVGDVAERDVIVETSAVHAVFSNRGAVLKSWKLKHYLDSKGTPIDILPSAIRDTNQKPFALTLDDPALSKRVDDALFKASTERLRLNGQAGTLTFEYRDAAGLSITKTFELQASGHPYLIKLTPEVTTGGRPLRVMVNGGSGFGDFERGVQPSGFFATTTYQPPQAIYQEGSEVFRVPGAQIAKQPIREGTFPYVGVDDHYFLAALLPGNRRARVEYQPRSIASETGPRSLVDYRVRVAGNGPLTFYYGPKDVDILQAASPELIRVIHFGSWFGWLATPLLTSLKWVNGYVGNYGWSIILLTMIINLLMFPLRHKSAVSMRKMQEIQPQVKAIQERYAKLKVTDPQRQKMNTEMMNLYREKGVNPASGCFPMLLTFPVLFAFYAVLSVAIELRGAPWVGWIHDLSTYDPLYITPLLMGASQFWQTRMMPPTGDPAQQRIMMFMPLMFLVFFLWAPSGLVLYWLVSNLWTIGQQHLTNRLLGTPPKPGSRTPERKAKKVEGRRSESEASI